MKPIPLRDLGLNGLIRSAEVDDYLLPDGAVTDAINVNFDRKGAVTLRDGLTLYGSQVSDNYTIRGLFNARFSNSSYNKLLTAVSDGTNNDIYYYNAGSWTKTLEDDTADLKTRFTSFGDRVIRVNGTDNMKCWDGNSANWDTSGNPINPDDMVDYDCSLIENFNLRVWAAGYSSNKDRLFFSSVVDSSGNITWTPGDDWDDVNPNDGENITALKKYANHLLVFKNNILYRHKGVEGIDPEPLIKLGTYSNEAVVEGKDGIYFHHPTGIYRYVGAYPEEISRPISDFIDAVPRSFYTNVASWKDSDHIYFSLGDLTVGGVSISNVVARYTISSKVWTIYSYSNELRIGTDYDDGSTIYQVVGDTDGNVYTFDNGTSDNGTTIKYRLVTGWYELGSIAERKIIREMVSLCEKAQGSILMYQIDDEAEWHEIGQIRKYLNHYQLDIRCHRIRFKITGSSDKEAFVFRGIEILTAASEGIIPQK